MGKARIVPDPETGSATPTELGSNGSEPAEDSPAHVRHTFMVDASYDLPRRVTGIGVVIRRSDKPKRDGLVIDRISEAYSGIPAGSIEQFAVLRALEIARERGYRVIRIRTDCNPMKRHLRKDYELNIGHEGGDIHAMVLRLARHFQELTFRYARRRKNAMAHNLAREALRCVTPVPRCDVTGATTAVRSERKEHRKLAGIQRHQEKKRRKEDLKRPSGGSEG
ncbi:MAG: reverse transcriptase-like protein [Candidatus Eiseniibacteriota bacterium]|nr:MAG: reverse transcriptase-like protein [Candidatus Eisenbacteria bacterium]